MIHFSFSETISIFLRDSGAESTAVFGGRHAEVVAVGVGITCAPVEMMVIEIVDSGELSV